MIVKIIIDLFKYYNVKNGNTTPSWVWPIAAVLLGCVSAGLLFVAAGGVLTVQSSAQQIIIGILAAVAIPNITGTATEARLAKQQATLGMLKSAWGSAYAIAKVAPTCAQVVAQAQSDPICSGTTAITCAGVTKADGTGSASFACVDSANFPNITCAAIGC